jgi:hypothetical protein
MDRGQARNPLTSEPEKATETFKAVQKLQEFKAFLNREYLRGMFSASEELAMLDAIAVANIGRQTDHGPTSTTRIWNPLFCHPLQPAQHFRGREAELEELKK